MWYALSSAPPRSYMAMMSAICEDGKCSALETDEEARSISLPAFQQHVSSCKYVSILLLRHANRYEKKVLEALELFKLTRKASNRICWTQY
ncbi:hypothetical protein KP509_30G003000 [Ceratopteris richardii]|uniref:Uncharacterized protein n=1 Tax=Ceratopteris richardii TaxID=49495 RepID=A0A8T2R167_CERRI|nr:hypothetical protein KP509_30G003000 [Ceratopteris richardii]